MDRSGTLIEAAKGAAGAIRARAAAAEAARQIPAETMRELVAAGLFRIFQPARFGGFELGYETYLPAAIEIAKACGSTGWVFSVLGMHNWQVALFPPRAQDDVWRDSPEALVSSSYAPTGTGRRAAGGFELSGRWSFASGCDYTGWSVLGAMVPLAEGGAPEFAFFLVPCADYVIEDDWHVVGLAGTRSKSLLLEGAFVPEHRVFAGRAAGTGAPPGAEVNRAPIYRVPFFIGTGHCTSVPGIGVAAGAYHDYVTEIGVKATRPGLGSGSRRIAEFPTIQMRVAEAGGLIDAAQRVLLANAADLVAEAASHGQPSLATRMRARRDHAFALRMATWAVDLLFESEGGQGLFANNLIQRAWRDVHACAMHIGMNWDRAGTLYGRYALGLEG
jgi:alkylation response protein AidB-like acyl-CoA dehydrogenase